jgi:hypothetical protein
MFSAGGILWRWLADQPAYIEVAIGMAFVLILVPGTLAAVAVLCTKVEAMAATIAVRLLLPSSVKSFAHGAISSHAETKANASLGRDTAIRRRAAMTQ